MAVLVDKGKCTGCGACISVCPLEAIRIADNLALISDECADCGSCIDECPDKAISLPD